VPTPPPVVPTDRDLRIERPRVHPAGFGGIYI